MPIPASVLRAGFSAPEAFIHPNGGKFRRLMIGTDGPPDTGKTEFYLSAPGPGVSVLVDRGIDGVVMNKKPPKSRGDNWAFKVINLPKAGQVVQSEFLTYWRDFYTWYKTALELPEVRTVVVDGDSDTWELQRLAEFGKLTQVPPIMYTSVNAARRAMYARAYDSGKIIITTNKVKAGYTDVLDSNGNPVMGTDGKPKREKSGELERQGFPDQDYLFGIQLRHMYEPPKVSAATAGPMVGKIFPAKWGIRIMKCKNNPELVGEELWGDQCNFRGLVEFCYPEVDPKEWGL